MCVENKKTFPSNIQLALFAIIFFLAVFGIAESYASEHKNRETIGQRFMQIRWNPSNENTSLSAEVSVEDLNWSGQRRAVVRRSSGSSTYDSAAKQACQSVIDDFPHMGFWGDTYVFNFTSRRKSVQYRPPGCIGYLALLSRYGSESLGNAETTAEEYVRERWTADRIRDYCRSETLLPTCLRNPNVGFGGHRRIEGSSVAQSAPDVGSLNWWAGVVNGSLSNVVITVQRDNAFWMLESGMPGLKDAGDDEFLMRRISDTLFNSIMFFELANMDRIEFKRWKVRRKKLPSTEKLIRTRDGQIVAYECELRDGKKVRAKLDKSMSINSVLVNGVSDSAWNSAVRDQSSSFHALEQYDSFGFKTIPAKQSMESKLLR